MTEQSNSLHKYYGLIVIIILSLIFIIDLIFFHGQLRIIMGILFVGYFPGYSALYAILPIDENHADLELLLLSVAGSIVIVSFVALALAISFIGFSLNSVLISLIIIMDIFCIVGLLRRRKLLKLELSKKGNILSVTGRSPKTKQEILIYIVFYLVIMIFIGVSLYSIYAPSQQEYYTEFYIPNQNQFLTGTFSTSRDRSTMIPLVVNNHEGADIIYELQVIVVTTDGRNIKIAEEYLSVKKDTKHEENLLLNTQSFDIKSIQLVLYKAGQSTPYRTLELLIQSDEKP